MCVTLANTGVRPIIITNIYLNAGKQNLIINKIMVDFTAMDLKMEFPKELLPESSAEIHIPYSDLSKSIAMLLARGEIPANQNLKILATDTTSVRYFCKTELTPKRIVQIGGNENG